MYLPQLQLTDRDTFEDPDNSNEEISEEWVS